MNTKSNRKKSSQKDNWAPIVANYSNAHLARSLWQVTNTFVPLIVAWYIMYLSLGYGYWLTLLLAPITAGLMIRVFIIQHDCGHGSFFNSRKMNDLLGSICGVITLTPYHYWRKTHAIHHATAGDLGHRGIGDIYTLTVQEYLEQSKWGRLKYRLYRNPFVLFILAPVFLFAVLYRFWGPNTESWKKERLSVLLTDFALVSILIIFATTIGLKAFFMMYIPVLILSSMTGTWLFFVQHQFEDTYWAAEDNWDYTLAALQGSSYYKLPKVLQWFTGNIGFHHIHHLSPRIPNYMLEKCHKENEIFQQVVQLTLWTSLRSIFLALWDEQQQKLVSFRYLKRLQNQTN